MAFCFAFGYACFAITEEGGQVMAEDIKNLCAPIPSDLHAKVREHQEASGKTLGQYMAWLITQFYEYEKGGNASMADNKRTVAFQVPADLFEQFKAYLEKNHIKQNAFFLDCIQRALADEKCSTMPCRKLAGFCFLQTEMTSRR